MLIVYKSLKKASKAKKMPTFKCLLTGAIADASFGSEKRDPIINPSEEPAKDSNIRTKP